MNVYLFGKLIDVTGQKKRIRTPRVYRRCNPVDRKKWPELEDHTYLLVVNEEIVTDNCTLNPDDEIALLPPYAGG